MLKIFLISLGVFAISIGITEHAFAKTTYKVKPNGVVIGGRAMSSKVPIGTPKEPSKISDIENVESSDDYKLYEQLSEAKPMFKNWTTIKAYNKINTVGTKLLESSGISENIVFSVKSSRNANATASTHGEVTLYTGMLKYVETEDELAAVLGHEIGHLVNNDPKRSTYRKVALALAGMPTNLDAKLNRNEEYKADITSVDIMVNAGYNPLGEISILNKISGHYNDTFSTHPTGRKRLNSLYTYIKTYYPQYLQNGYQTVSYNRALKIIGVE